MPTEQKFVERTKDHVKEKCDGIANHVLLAMWEKDVNAYDVHYIEKRVFKIFDEMIKKINFANIKIEQERKKKFEKAILDALKAETEPEIETEPENIERRDRCEGVCQEVVKLLLSKDLLMSDKMYFKDAIKGDDELLLHNLLRIYTSTLFDTLVFSIDESLKRANKKLYGVEKEDISMKQIDNILKSK